MKKKNQKRIAASILKVGINKVWLDPSKLAEIKEAITRKDIKSLIGTKAIKAKPKIGQSKFRARKIKKQKSKGLRKGKGSRKGSRTARLPRKKEWMNKIRSQRKLIRSLKEKKLIKNKDCRNLLKKAKSGVFRNMKHIKLYIKENNLINKNEIRT